MFNLEMDNGDIIVCHGDLRIISVYMNGDCLGIDVLSELPQLNLTKKCIGRIIEQLDLDEYRFMLASPSVLGQIGNKIISALNAKVSTNG